MSSDATSTPMSVRARARAEITQALKDTARRHLSRDGASGLSLRAVARDLGMASSAVYRYFPSRDELLTALIIDAFDAVGAEAEQAVAAAPPDLAARWLAMAQAIRGWAHRHPHDYALVYGSPVPGYRAPRETVPPASRVSAVALGVVADAAAAGQIDVGRSAPLPETVRADLERLRQAAAPDLTDDVLARVLVAWSTLFGAISLELFGHLEGVVEHGDATFTLLMEQVVELLAAGPARRS